MTQPSGPDTVAVFDTATCNTRELSGCQQTPALLSVGTAGPVGRSNLDLADNPVTHTLYVSNYFDPGFPGYQGKSVYMINTAVCDARDHTGCGQTPIAISAGTNPIGVTADANPSGVVVDTRTDTVYTADLFDGEFLGRVSIINGSICNSTN